MQIFREVNLGIYVSIDMLKSPTVGEVLVNPSHFESKIEEKKNPR